MLNKQFHNGDYIARYSLVDGELSVVYIAQVVEYECMMEGKLLFVHKTYINFDSDIVYPNYKHCKKIKKSEILFYVIQEGLIPFNIQ